MPVTPTPVNPQVTVYPAVGSTAAYCSPNSVSPVGANATITFKIAPGNPTWSFASSNAFQIKSTQSPQPPAGMFTNPNPNSQGNLVVQDKNGDGVFYSYNLKITKGTTTVTIDPYIQNDTDNV
jgi:hypothetical protein